MKKIRVLLTFILNFFSICLVVILWKIIGELINLLCPIFYFDALILILSELSLAFIINIICKDISKKLLFYNLLFTFIFDTMFILLFTGEYNYGLYQLFIIHFIVLSILQYILLCN